MAILQKFVACYLADLEQKYTIKFTKNGSDGLGSNL